jgi:hypothetical protein
MMAKRKFYNLKIKEYSNGEKVSILYSDSIEYGQHVSRGVRGYSISPQRSLKASLKRTKQSIIDLSKNNSWEWFVTITLDKEKIDRYNYDEISKKLSKKLNNLKRVAPNMSYMIVPELHEDGAYHFHGLFSNIDNLKIVDSKKKTKDGKPIYNIKDFNLGFTTATKITDTKKASFYISKYVTKDLLNKTFNKKRYWCSQDLEKPNQRVEMIMNSDFEAKEKELATSSSLVKSYSYTPNTERTITVKYFYE